MTRNKRRQGARLALRLSIFATISTAGCGLIQVKGLPSSSAASEEPAAQSGSSEKPKAPAFDKAAYDTCAAEFDQHYSAWLPIDQEAKTALTKARSAPPYEAVPALVSAYLKVEDASSERQSGEKPAGHVFAKATKVELTRELLRIGTSHEVNACLDRQFEYEPNQWEFLPPLTGDPERDKVERCGSPDPAVAAARRDARQAMAEEASKLLNAYRSPKPTGAMYGRVRALDIKPDHVVLTVDELASDYVCVPNGRYGMVGGSWGPLCDYEDRPPTVVRKHTFHGAKQETPFKLQPGDGIGFTYELDPNAPASSEKVPMDKGRLWIASVERKRKPIFEVCVRTEIWSLHQPSRRR